MRHLNHYKLGWCQKGGSVRQRNTEKFNCFWHPVFMVTVDPSVGLCFHLMRKDGEHEFPVILKQPIASQ